MRSSASDDLPLAAVARPDPAPAPLVRSEGVTHPLRDLAALGTRERVRAAVGVCVDFDPDEHAERIVAEVLRVRVPELGLIEALQAFKSREDVRS